MATLLKVKRLYDPVAADDGMRIFVDRLWPRGLAKKNAPFAAWYRDLAPSPELRRWFAHDPSRWNVFQCRYLNELAGKEELVAILRKDVELGPVTLVYAAKDTEHNHALVLAAYVRGENALTVWDGVHHPHQ